MRHLLHDIIEARAASAEPYPGALPLADIFQRLRVSLGLSQRATADLGGVSHLTVARYENGATAVPTSLNGERFRRVLTAMVEEATRLAAPHRPDREPEAEASVRQGDEGR